MVSASGLPAHSGQILRGDVAPFPQSFVQLPAGLHLGPSPQQLVRLKVELEDLVAYEPLVLDAIGQVEDSNSGSRRSSGGLLQAALSDGWCSGTRVQ